MIAEITEKSLTDVVFEKTIEYMEGMPKEKRKGIGQFFTSPETAKFMASLYSPPKKRELSVLDPGSGSGILTAAVVERLQKEDVVKRINITCYETCEDIILVLKQNLEYIKKVSIVPVEYVIIQENYILHQGADFNNSGLCENSILQYDWIICNPPYKKISKNSAEAQLMKKVCFGTPNMYFLFSSMSLYNLDKEGEIVLIIPRSWTSGAYFKVFREYLLGRGTLKHIHLFTSRKKVFDKENVAQETVIIKLDRSELKDTVTITTSESNSRFDNINVFKAPYTDIIVGYQKFVFLISCEEDLGVVQNINKFTETLPSLGLKLKTGLIVDFRNMKYMSDKKTDEMVPVICSQNVKDGKITFDEHTRFISKEKRTLIRNSKNVLILKRFTAKEEKRRLQCGVFLSSAFPEYTHITTDNKVNFIEGIGFELTEEQAYGLYAIFNSTTYDEYYRVLNGSTQVNSTEMNSIPVPAMDKIESLGRTLLEKGDVSVQFCDKLLLNLIL